MMNFLKENAYKLLLVSFVLSIILTSSSITVVSAQSGCPGGMVSGAGGACACPSDSFWDGVGCVYSDGSVGSSNPCPGGMVSGAGGACACPSDSFWDGVGCVASSGGGSTSNPDFCSAGVAPICTPPSGGYTYIQGVQSCSAISNTCQPIGGDGGIFATQETAESLANCLGGTAHAYNLLAGPNQPLGAPIAGPYSISAPVWEVSFPNGQGLNAGLTAGLINSGEAAPFAPGTYGNTFYNTSVLGVCGGGSGGGGGGGGGGTGGGGGGGSTNTYLNTSLRSINSALNRLLTVYNSTTGITTTGPAGLTVGGQSVTVNADVLNVRYAPTISATIIRRLNAGGTFTGACYVVGETVEGSNRWWRTTDNNYIWAGGTTPQPTTLCR